MQFVTIDRESSERVKEVRLRAEDPSNWRFNGEEVPNEGFLVRFEPRCQAIYTVDVSKERPYRHLSVSTWDEEGNLLEVPRFLLFIIAQMFGLTLADGNSLITPDRDNEMVIHALEPLEFSHVAES